MMFQFHLYISGDYSYRFYLTPKLSASSLSYRDLFLDEPTDKVGYDCKAMICFAHLAFVWVVLMKTTCILNIYLHWQCTLGLRDYQLHCLVGGIPHLRWWSCVVLFPAVILTVMSASWHLSSLLNHLTC